MTLYITGKWLSFQWHRLLIWKNEKKIRDIKDIKNIKLVSKNTIYAQVYKLKEVIDGDSIQNQYLGKY